MLGRCGEWVDEGCRAEFRIRREPWGFSAAHRDDTDSVIYFRRQD